MNEGFGEGREALAPAYRGAGAALTLGTKPAMSLNVLSYIIAVKADTKHSRQTTTAQKQSHDHDSHNEPRPSRPTRLIIVLVVFWV
jgi:hypothetical protein